MVAGAITIYPTSLTCQPFRLDCLDMAATTDRADRSSVPGPTTVDWLTARRAVGLEEHHPRHPPPVRRPRPRDLKAHGPERRRLRRARRPVGVARRRAPAHGRTGRPGGRVAQPPVAPRGPAGGPGPGGAGVVPRGPPRPVRRAHRRRVAPCIEQAAPHHVAGVRALFLDHLDPGRTGHHRRPCSPASARRSGHQPLRHHLIPSTAHPHRWAAPVGQAATRRSLPRHGSRSRCTG
jgi:hypothetical protein